MLYLSPWNSQRHWFANFRFTMGFTMQWLGNSLVGLVLLTRCACQVKTATREQLGEIFLRHYTGNHIEEYDDVTCEEAETLAPRMDSTKPTMVYIHGWSENVNKTSVHTVINAYLQRNDHNVLAIDWGSIAIHNYVTVTLDIESVGKEIALALNDMVQAGLPSEKIHVVGHSMGCHVSGYVGRNVDFSLQRITGLDPAGPYFNTFGQQLSQADARFVDIIHTDWNFYGIAKATGTVDFFPNSGRRIQPGCPILPLLFSKDDFCSHHRSWIFYAESVINERAFVAIRCPNVGRFPVKKRRDSTTVLMGYATPTDAKGSYCLVTGSSSPYGLGLEGAREA